MGIVMKIMLVSICVLVVFGCGRPNEKFCCVTEATCAAAGIDELRPCGAGQACGPGASCVAKECDTSIDCTSPDAPSCSNGLCIAGCAIDDDCAGVVGAPRCDSVEATCVGCVSADQCPAEAAICDPETRSCRGCTSDDDCASGVCVEADGTCALDDDILYVTTLGNDAGSCPKAAPCRTIDFAAQRITAARRIIRILGGSYDVGATTVVLAQSVILDGTNTVLRSSANPAFAIGGPSTIERVTLPENNGLEVGIGGSLRLHQAIAPGNTMTINGGGSMAIRASVFTGGSVTCNPGAELTVHSSRSDRTEFFASNCSLTVSSSRLVSGGLPSFDITGRATIENNVFEEATGSDGTVILSTSPGTTFRHNTVVVAAGVPGSCKVRCQGSTVDFSSNIIACNSDTATTAACEPRFTLFDLPGGPIATQGVGNVAADLTTFFLDRANGDYHLAPNSPARGIGEAGLVEVDLDENPRPNPAGSKPDCGAYEAP
jgi:hypothetical protein